MIKENISLVKHCYGFFFSLAELKVRLNNSNEFIIQHNVFRRAASPLVNQFLLEIGHCCFFLHRIELVLCITYFLGFSTSGSI